MPEKSRNRRPSPALVMSIIALVFALVGTAAASVATISVLNKKEKKQTKKIADREVKKLGPNLSVKSAGTVSDGAISAAKLGDGAVTAAKLGGGAVVAGKLGTITVRTATVSIPSPGNDQQTASCNAGERLIGGGSDTLGVGLDPGWTVKRSGPVGGTTNPTGWSAAAQNATTDNPATLVVEAICLGG
jgi:hypothetical protein